MTETWKTCVSHEAYEVSDQGRIRNKMTGQVHKCGPNNKGYSATRGSRARWYQRESLPA